MAWIIPAESDVLTVLSETELATYRAAATASGQADPVAPTLAQVVDLVRGYVGAYKPNTLGLPGTIPQKLLAPALDLVAVRLPQRVGVSPKDVRQMAAGSARCVCSNRWRRGPSISRSRTVRRSRRRKRRGRALSGVGGISRRRSEEGV